MFNDLPTQNDTFKVPSEETKTPAASSAEQKTPSEKQNASEGAKTPETKEKESGTDFHQHSRFKELLEERDKARAEANDWRSKYDTLSSTEQRDAKQQASEATGVAKSEIPNFETVEDLVKWVSSQTSAAKQEAISAYRAEQESASRETQKIDEMITNELDELAKGDEKLVSKEGRDALIQFALENELTNLKIAHNLFQKINTTKEDGVKKGEEIAKRKENSGPKSTSTGSSETKIAFRRGQSLSDAIAEAKSGLIRK